MFEKLVIRNFQKHRKLTLEFDQNITTLWGSTDSGKSAIIRALIWVCLNQRPDKHIHFDAKWSKVELHVDGHIISRKQGESNTYRLDNGKPSKSFNKGVPRPIAEILNVAQENFQQQHDPHFWISLSSGKVSKELNRIINLDVIDRSLYDVASKLRTALATVRVTEKRLEEASERRRKLRWVKDLDAKLKEIEASHAKITDLQQREQELTVLIDKVQEYQHAIQTLEELGTKGQEMLVQGRVLGKKVIKLGKLVLLISEYNHTNKLRKIDVPNIDPVNRLYELDKLIEEYQETEQCLSQKQRKLRSVGQKLSKQKLCPVCKKPIRS